MKRITPEMVLAAKEATGFDVTRNHFFKEIDGKVCLCGLSIVAVHKGLHWLELKNAKSAEDDSGDTTKQLELVCKSLDIPVPYAEGFYDGFDSDYEIDQNKDSREEAYSQAIAGVNDGRACAAALGLTPILSDD